MDEIIKSVCERSRNEGFVLGVAMTLAFIMVVLVVTALSQQFAARRDKQERGE